MAKKFQNYMMKSGSWICVFLIDITSKLNELNQNLKGANKLFASSYQDIKTFIANLKYIPHLHDFDMKTHF